MRVALLSDYPLPGQPPRGAMQNNGAYLVKGLATNTDVETHVVSCHTELGEGFVEADDSVSVHYLPRTRRFSMLTFYARDAQRIRRTLESIQPDIVHAQGAEMYAYVASTTGLPWVMTVHGIRRYEARFARGMDWLRRVLQDILVQRTCFRRARSIICISPYVHTVVAAYTGAHLYDIELPINPFWFELQNRPTGCSLLYIGSLIRRKGLVDLLMALDRIRNDVSDVRIRVAGDVPAADLDAARYHAEILRYVATKGLSDSVDFLGFLDHQRLAAELECGSVLVLPSGQETAPTVIAEAMAVGMPVVATRVGGIPFLVEDGVTGFLTTPGDVSALADALIRVLRDRSLARRMGTQAKSAAWSRFHPSVVAARTVECYRDALYHGVSR